MTVRLLTLGDEPVLEAFLGAHRDSSMIPRANIRRVGIVYEGQAFGGQYVGAFRDGAIVAFAGHSWNGVLIVQATEQVAEVTRACVAISGRKVTGILGPLEHVIEARAALGLAEVPAKKDEDEALCALDLDELCIPQSLATGAIVCRPPVPEEREQLYAWRVAYNLEILGGVDSADLRRQSASMIDWQINDGLAWVALENGKLVSFSGYNSALPDIVQLGGIYTPPEHRARGHARAAIAAQLLASRRAGVERAVLFASDPFAMRCYEGLGFRQIGEFGLVLW